MGAIPIYYLFIMNNKIIMNFRQCVLLFPPLNADSPIGYVALQMDFTQKWIFISLHFGMDGHEMKKLSERGNISHLFL